MCFALQTLLVAAASILLCSHLTFHLSVVGETLRCLLLVRIHTIGAVVYINRVCNYMDCYRSMNNAVKFSQKEFPSICQEARRPHL